MIETEIDNTTKTMLEDFRRTEKEKDVCAVILKVNNEKFKLKDKSYNIKLFGKTMTEWVANSVFDADIRYAECDFNDDFLPIVKRCVNPTSKYTIILFSDTPLLSRKTYLQVMEYFRLKNLSVLKLTRGYVFETEYLLTIDNLLNPQIQYFEEEDFITCFDLKQTAMVRDVLKNRILNYFMRSGVIIKDISNTFIDANVQIMPNTVIEPNCYILGETIIESGCEIGYGCKIESSVVCENSKVHGSIVSQSFISKNVIINENCKIENNAKIEEDVVVPYCVNINGVVVSKETNLNSFFSYVAKNED